MTHDEELREIEHRLERLRKLQRALGILQSVLMLAPTVGVIVALVTGSDLLPWIAVGVVLLLSERMVDVKGGTS